MSFQEPTRFPEEPHFMGCRSRKVHLGVFYEVIRPTFQKRWNEVEERARGGKEPSAAAVIERYC